jgi:hypothetical protein
MCRIGARDGRLGYGELGGKNPTNRPKVGVINILKTVDVSHWTKTDGRLGYGELGGKNPRNRPKEGVINILKTTNGSHWNKGDGRLRLR